MTKQKRGILFGLGLMVAGIAIVLSSTACSVGVSKGGVTGSAGPDAWVRGAQEAAGATGEAVTALGAATGNPILLVLGYGLTFLGAAKTAKSMLAKHDAAPFVGANGETATEAEVVAAAKARAPMAANVGPAAPKGPVGTP